MHAHRLLWCFCTLMLFSGLLQSGEAPSDLFSDNELDILRYLEQHRIPHIPLSSGAGPTYNAPNFQREIDRALKLFKSGSTTLRLAIARQLRVEGEKIIGFWDACGADDWEAKHYLVGEVLYAMKDDKKLK